ncbi:MAG: hypothetical protein DHS20C13_03280 [Thermodesulfobacteriota bacterium]|nr:MAG: hypothetical protein DHS20C13_03280 [Thermodesulfobacteriota bacterium]
MNNKTFLYCAVLLFLSAIAFNLLYSTNASAQRMLPDARAVTQCYNSKLKASGKYVNCLLRAERNANRNMVDVSDDDIAHCHENFEQRFMRAEANAAEQGAECPSHGGLVPYQQTVVDASSTINSNNDVKTISIMILPEDLEYVMSKSLNLNIAIKVNGAFNVIWRSVSTQNLTQLMEFQWSPVFQVFGAEDLGEMETTEVDIETNVVNIALGQDVVLGKNEILEKPVAGNNPDSIGFVNNSEELIYAALAQQLTLVGSSQAITSIYFEDIPLNSGQSNTMTPTQEVLLWFESNTSTGEIIRRQPAALSTIEDLTNASSLTLNFSNMQWSTPEEN